MRWLRDLPCAACRACFPQRRRETKTKKVAAFLWHYRVAPDKRQNKELWARVHCLVYFSEGNWGALLNWTANPNLVNATRCFWFEKYSNVVVIDYFLCGLSVVRILFNCFLNDIHMILKIINDTKPPKYLLFLIPDWMITWFPRSDSNKLNRINNHTISC